jgi:CheY-like chemotaxis protein
LHALILTLHENDDNAHQVAESLKLSGHNVIMSKNFAHAISVLGSHQVDMVISDVHLENGGNVFDFLRWVKRNPSTSAIPFVMFSSRPTVMAKYVEDGIRTAARMLGAAMFITMEIFDTDRFRARIDSLLPAEDLTQLTTTKGGGE